MFLDQVRIFVDRLQSMDVASRLHYLKFSYAGDQSGDLILGGQENAWDPSPTVDCPLVRRLIVDALEGEKDGGEASLLSDLKRSCGGAEVYSQVRSLINELVFDFDLELSSHGLVRTFRFWSPIEKARYFAESAQIIQLLESAGYRAFHSYGTLLGIIRESDLLAHDDDVDIIVIVDRDRFFNCPRNVFFHKFTSELGELGVCVHKAFANHLHVSFAENGRVLDVFFAVLNEGAVELWPAQRKLVSVSSVFPLRHFEFQVGRATVPNDAVAVLEAIYGPTWHIKDELYTLWDGRGNGGSPLAHTGKLIV